ncbi:MAG: hypothetical protein DRP09_15415 [Candidatus Thorarchaeota archaeon]|nr:MAG: hypothetical protein DRP09_15415 [Candidatus Thorarchaeota archaeon]
MWILAYFTQDGEPALGLSPVVTIRDVETGNIVISGASMIEKGDGFYGYYFTSFNPEQNYAIICDSVTLSGVERYTYAASGEYHDVLNDIESTVGIVDLRTDLLRKVQTNRLELFDGDTDNWILYDDDGITPLLTFSVSDKDGNIIVQCPNTPSKRSHAKGLSISGSGTSEIYMRKSVYDPDNNGYVNAAETITDGIYTSTAIQVKNAVDNTHSAYQLGTKFVTESGISGGKVLTYDSNLDKLVYTTISGITVSGVSDHGQLIGLLDDDHKQYILVNGSRAFTGEVEGIYPTKSGSLVTKQYVDDVLASKGAIRYGREHLTYNDTYIDVSFHSPLNSTDYSILISLEKETSPISEFSYTITNKTINGFRVNFSGYIDDNDYYLNWQVAASGIAQGNCLGEVKDDKSPELGGDLLLGEHGIELDTTPSGNFIHGYTIGYSGNFSYVNVDWNDTGFACPLHVKTNGHFEQCSAASGTFRMPCIALALEEGIGYKKVLWNGIIRKDSWSWTPGDIIYVSTVDGALTNIKPTISGSWVQVIGIAIAANVINFNSGLNVGYIN